MTDQPQSDGQIIAAFNAAHNYGRNEDALLVKKLRAGGLNDKHIAVAIEAISSTCNACWNADAGCYCTRDD